MNDKLFKWIELNKNKDKPTILFIKFLYSITYDWIYNLLVIIIPIFMAECDGILRWIFLIVLILLVLWYSLVNAYKNKRYKIEQGNICQYIGIPDKNDTNNIIFLIQLDAMEENVFGKDEEEIKTFYKNYIYPYISFLRHAYNMERNFVIKENI